ncbi:D-aspartate ligase [Ruaniaceae bacterium KH17]|nr:D-aspartate ligase [Ruaniaceae bacterium KH17]
MVAISPVLIGSDLGEYAIARQFHEVGNSISTTIANSPRGFINDSAILRTVIIGSGASDAALEEALDQAANAAIARDEKPVLLANTDTQVDFVNARRAQLEEKFAVLVTPEESVRAVTDKSLLAPLAQKVGLKTPNEAVLTQADGVPAAAAGLQAPYILKSASSSDWESLQFPGKLKVYVCQTVADVERHVTAAFEAGFTGKFLLQELIPGDDTAGYVTTQYVDRMGQITVQATARMLLAIHTPNLLGNMALGLVEWYPEIAEPVGQLLQGIGYRGFATADIKVDPRTGERYLLDINPRIGRSSYLMPIGGVHGLMAALADWSGRTHDPQRTSGSAVYRIVPKRLLNRYVTDPELLAHVKKAAHDGGAIHPLDYREDRNTQRTLFRYAASLNHMRNLREVYPRPTQTSF